MREHEPWCPQKHFGHSDSAKRLTDTYNLHRVSAGLLNFDVLRKWFAVRLSDGTSDQVLYDTKQEAIRHQHHNEQQYAFICIAPSSMNVCEAEVTMKTHRTLYDKGLRMVDPDSRTGGKDWIKRTSVEDQLSLSRGVVTGLLTPGRDF